MKNLIVWALMVSPTVWPPFGSYNEGVYQAMQAIGLKSEVVAIYDTKKSCEAAVNVKHNTLKNQHSDGSIPSVYYECTIMEFNRSGGTGSIDHGEPPKYTRKKP